MDPLSITAGVASLLGSLAALSKQITSFVVVAQGAKADMGAFLEEITSLMPALETLRQPELVRHYPDALRPHLLSIVRECDGVAGRMRELLSNLSSASWGRRMQWSLTSRDETDRLRQSLEARKSALQIAIGVLNLSTNQSLQEATSSIRGNAALIPEIREDTAQIADLRREIADLRLDLNLRNTSSSIPMQRFLEESTAYAETIYDDMEDVEGYTEAEFPEDTRDFSQSSEPSRQSHTLFPEPQHLREYAPHSRNPLLQADIELGRQHSPHSSSHIPFGVRRKPVSEHVHENEMTGSMSAEDWHDRSVEDALEVEDWPSPDPEIIGWASDVYNAVSFNKFKASARAIRQRQTFPWSLRGFSTIHVRVVQLKASNKAKEALRLSLVGKNLCLPERLVALLLEGPESYYACSALLKAAWDLRYLPSDLEWEFLQKILRHTIRLYDFDIFDLVVGYKIWGAFSHDDDEEILQTAVRCGAIEFMEYLLEDASSEPLVTPIDAWLGSCYAVWVRYALATKTSRFFRAGDHSGLGCNVFRALNINASSAPVVSDRAISYRTYAENCEPFRQIHETRIRRVLGWEPINFESRSWEDTEKDILACSRYLELKSPDYANQPWSTYKRYQARDKAAGFVASQITF